ncbi:MAG: 6-bladed beta-propeller [Bacteroidales bacterium]
MKNIMIIVLVLFAASCGNNPGTDKSASGNDENRFFTVDLENALGNKQLINLSQVASDVEYIKLETAEDCMVRPVVNYFFTDSMVLVQNFDHILKFSRKGKFLQRIGTSGRGPGEIDLIRIMSVIPEKRIIAVQKNSLRELLFFSFEGNFQKTVDFEPRYFNVKVLPDCKYVSYDPGSVGNEKYSFCLLDEKWDTLSAVENYTKWVSQPASVMIMVGWPEFKPFYLNRNTLHVKAMYNDTVYNLRQDKFYPEYFIDLGKYKLPEELRPERLGAAQFQKFRDNGGNYYFAIVHGVGGKVFLTAHSYSDSNPLKYILCDRSKNEQTLLTDTEGVSTGFINDWDGGLDFWPVGSISERKIFMPVNAMDLRKELENIRSGKKQVKYPGKQKELLKLISELEETDNPVIMAVTLKQDF